MARTPADVARTRAFWLASKPKQTGAPAYVLDPPAWWIVAMSLGVALALQSTLAPYLAVGGGAVSLVMLVVGWYAIRTGTLRGVAFGLLAGACEDALTGTSGIAWTFADAVAGGLAGRLAGTWLSDTKLFLVPASAALTFARFAAFAIVMQGQGRPLGEPLAHLHAVLWQAVFNLIVAFVALRMRPELVTRAHRN